MQRVKGDDRTDVRETRSLADAQRIVGDFVHRLVRCDCADAQKLQLPAEACQHTMML